MKFSKKLMAATLGFATVVVGGNILVGTALAAPVLDQSQELRIADAGLGFGFERGQTFTVGASGKLTSIDVWLRTNSTNDIIWNIYGVAGGVPQGTSLFGDSLIPPAQPNGDWISLDLTYANIFVTPGDQFLIGVNSSNGNPHWGIFEPNPYAGGAIYYRDGSDPWTNQSLVTPWDHMFRTYVDADGVVATRPTPPSDVPEPAPLALLGLGLFGVAIAKRRSSSSVVTT